MAAKHTPGPIAPYAEGASAAREGWSAAVNPHAEGTPEAEQWAAGFLDQRHSASAKAGEHLSEGFSDGLAGRPMQMCLRGSKYANDYRKGTRAAIAKATGSAA